MNLKEHDHEITLAVDKIVKSQKLRELMQMMTPLDLAHVMVMNFELCPHDAATTTLDIIKRVKEALASGPNIETNKDFPVPSAIRRDNDSTRGEEEDELSKAASGLDESGDNYLGMLGGLTPTFSQDQFPLPRPQEDGYPYDGMTNAKLNSKFQGKRGLTSGLVRVYKFIFQESDSSVHLNKPPLKQNLRYQIGGDGHGGLQQKMQGMDNDQSSSGSSWSTRGRAGWSKEMSDKTFSEPDDTNLNNKYQAVSEETVEDDFPELSILKQPPVGSSIPNTRGGERSDGGVFGGRKGFRKR